ncbi:hypothetical protein Mal52_17360 [Symmachiella dynata]|uniref:Uncharacterized protein n=1 Tax=Symmachiella dynata TaxID=2527995 RepID=A0A517ZL91_9PLAN|nr:hypothetical protein [Symmachiella dynata]QDU43264.1 hypothetical protein Mal52_17360 [Symmachiella dynata]
MSHLKSVAVMLPLFTLTMLFAPGCSDGPRTDEQVDVVYRCSETGEYVSAPPQPVPAVNPDTGRATLQRALYCSRCQHWYVVPPPNVHNGPVAGYLCPKHKLAMQEQGPLPE